MASLAALALAAALAALLFQVIRSYVRNLLWIKDIPHPGTPLPLIGHTNYFVGLTPEQILPKFYEICLGESGTNTRKAAAVLGHRPMVLLYHPETVQPILGSNVHLEKSEEYDFLLPWLNRGLLLRCGKRRLECCSCNNSDDDKKQQRQ